MQHDDARRSLVTALERQMTSEVMMKCLETILMDYPDLSAEERDTVVRECNDRRQGILQSLRDVVIDDDETEAVLMLPSIFLELRFEWSRYNAQIQYQTVKQGSASPQLLAKGTVISMMLGSIESSLTAENAFWVNRIASDPIGSVASRGDTIKRLLSFALNARDIQKRALDRLDEMRQSLVSLDAAPMVHAAIERAKEDGVAYSDRDILLRTNEIHDILELLVVEKLQGRVIRVVLQQGDVDSGATLLPEVVLALREALAGWLTSLFEYSVEPSAALREANYKSAYLNLRWNLRVVHQRLFFELEDDGCGTILDRPAAIPDDRQWAHLRLRITATQTPQVGSKIEVSAEVSSFGNFMVCAVNGPTGQPLTRIALVTTTVVSVLSSQQSINKALGTLRLLDGTVVPIVDFRDLWPDMDLAMPTETSVFVVISTERSGLLALRVDDIPGAIRGAMRPLPEATAVTAVSGVLLLSDGFALLLNPDRVAEQVLQRRPARELRYGS